MVNKNYNRGRAFEYRVKKHLEKKGYFVVRSAGSKSPFDLVAISRRVRYPDIMLIQCKYGTKIGKKERDNLYSMTNEFPRNVFIIIAWAKPNKPIGYYDSDNEKIEW